MLTLFRTNQTLANLFILVMILLLRLPVVLFDFDWAPVHKNILGESIFGAMGTDGWLPYLVTSLFIFLQALWLNELNNTHRLTKRMNLFPGYFLAIVSCFLPVFLVPAPMHYANLFLVFAFGELLRTFRLNEAAIPIFNLGLLVGIASLFYFSYTVFLLLAIFGLNLMRALKGQEILMVLFGYLAPYIIATTYLFWHDLLDPVFLQHFQTNVSFLSINFSNNAWFNVQLGLMVTLVLWSILGSGGILSRRVMREQKKINALYWCLFISLISVFFQANLQLTHWLLTAMPLGLFLGIAFTNLRPQLAETLNLFLLLIILFLQYKGIFNL